MAVSVRLNKKSFSHLEHMRTIISNYPQLLELNLLRIINTECPLQGENLNLLLQENIKKLEN